MSEKSYQKLTIKHLQIHKYHQKEIIIRNSSKSIYGIAYIPDIEKNTFPLVIISHGLGDCYNSNILYSKELATHGVSTYMFDFCGGGGTKSEGETTKMSVMTEVNDLEVVIQASQKWDFVDSKRIILLGHSQGGIVSAITAARHVEYIFGLILLSPAFSLSEILHKMFSSIDKVPKKFHFLYIEAGSRYAEDIWDYDVYKEIAKYDKKVLILHGNKDELVPISYSEIATEVYNDCELCIIDGAGHEFNENEILKSSVRIFNYFNEIGLNKEL